MSTVASSLKWSRPVVLAAIALLFVGLTPVLADHHEPKKIRKFGNPVTAFSTQPADSLDGLRSQFSAHRADLEDAIRQSGWEGDPADLFDAVAGGGDIQRVQVPPGEALQWMVFRKNKKPAVTHNLVWAGKEPFDAWQIQFESNDKTWDFLVPVVCLNLALYKVGPPSPPPSCSLEATVGAAQCDELSQITLVGSTDGTKIEITDVGGGSTAGLSSAGSSRWTYTPSAAGKFEFTATATSARGKTATCSARATVAEADPCVTCSITATDDVDSRTITVTDDGSVGTLDITGVTLPDGSAGDMSKLISASGGRWTFTTKKTRKPGSYTWTFAARAERSGKTDDCEAAVTRDVPEPDYAWIFRAVGARVDADGSIFQSSFLPDGSNLRDDFKIEPGYGFGASIERVFTPRIGLELGVLLADLDSVLLRDIDVDWEQSDENVGLTVLSLGPNFHLSPGSSVDFYIGPFIAYTELDDVTHRVLGSNVRIPGEEEITWGAQIGLDVPTSSSWAFTAGIRYLELSYDIGEGDDEANEIEIGLDPLIFTAGIAYRF